MSSAVIGHKKSVVCFLLCVILGAFILGCGLYLRSSAFDEMPVENGFIYVEQNGGIITGIKTEVVDEDGAVVILKALKGKAVKRVGHTGQNAVGAEIWGGFIGMKRGGKKSV